MQFLNYDGTVLKTEYVQKGNAATPPSNPTKPSSEYYDYVFNGWDKDYNLISGDTVITAKFKSVEREVEKYTVTFYNYDNTVLSVQEVKIGKDATAPSNPTRPDTAEHHFEFIGWDKDFTDVKNDLEVIAQYKEIIPKQNDSGCKKDLSIVVVSLIALVSVSFLIWKREK